MKLSFMLSFFVLLRVDLFTCLKIAIPNSLALNNSQHGWAVSAKIIGFCFNPTTRIVIFSNDWQDDWQPSFLKSTFAESSSYIFDDNADKTLQKYPRFRNIYVLESIHVSHKTFPANSVTIFMHKDIDLSGLLDILKRSIWWNSRAKLLLVSFDELSCKLAKEVLNIVWSFNILSVIFLCKNRENNWSFYTYNPYSYLAPPFWKNNERNTRADIKWTLFQHNIGQFDEYLEADYLPSCKCLYFDKLQDMRGYNFKLVGAASPIYYNKNETGFERCSSSKLAVVCQALKSMNAVFTIKFTNVMGLIKPNGQPYDNINEIISGISDFSLFYIFHRDYWWLQTYPFMYSNIKILTPIQSRYAFHFIRIFKASSWLFLALLTILTILLLQFLLKISFVSGALEFVRIFVNSATRRGPMSNFERICFFFLIYLWLMINIYIQSNFSTDKVITDENKAIDSLEDLMNSNLTVGGFGSYLDMLPKEKTPRNFSPNRNVTCAQRLLHKENIACVVNTEELLLLPDKARLYVSKSSVVERGVTWLFPDDSPILSKVDSVTSRFNEAGIINFHAKQKKFRPPKNETIDSSEFYIAVHILIGGFVLAIGIAMIEIIIGTLIYL